MAARAQRGGLAAALLAGALIAIGRPPLALGQAADGSAAAAPHRRFEYKYSFKGPHLVQADGTVPFWVHTGSKCRAGGGGAAPLFPRCGRPRKGKAREGAAAAGSCGARRRWPGPVSPGWAPGTAEAAGGSGGGCRGLRRARADRAPLGGSAGRAPRPAESPTAPWGRGGPRSV